MKTNLRLFFTILFAIVGLSKQSVAQGLDSSRESIIKINGSDFTSGINKGGLIFINYHNEEKNMHDIAYFFNASNNCVMIISGWQPSMANMLITRFNRDYVKLSEGNSIVYKDYQTNIIQEVTISEEVVSIRMFRE